jgi:broad specificity phosphatase PhoE
MSRHRLLPSRFSLAVATLGLAAALAQPAGAEQTLVFLRHGEKPAAGLGQLSCQGLQRALALPKVLSAKFGVPQAIFASDPGALKDDRGRRFNYVRPLATIEPTAIRLGLPVDTRYGFEDTEGLLTALQNPALKSATVFIAWEHRVAQDIAREMIRKSGGDPTVVPRWESEDFDSLYVVTVDESGKAQFRLDHQGLDKLPDTCP